MRTPDGVNALIPFVAAPSVQTLKGSILIPRLKSVSFN